MLIAIPDRKVHEWERLHPVLEAIALDWAEEWGQATGEEIAVVTSIKRDRARTVEIYRAAGKSPPATSVHETDPVRGIDFSIRRLKASQIADPNEFHGFDLVEVAVQMLNDRWRYNEAETHAVALFHDVSGPHVHLQCRPGEETVRR